MIMGAWRPLRAFAMALFFGFVNAVASQLQQSGLGVTGEPSGFFEWTLAAITSPQILATLPYVAVLVLLGLAAGRVRPPGAVGQPYVKGDQ
jgi:general nucleoside transport system permease protein